MQVTVTFRHLEASDALRDHATEKVTKIAAKYVPKATGAHVILSVSKQRHEAEINLHAPHFDISAHNTTGDMYAAIDGAMTKLETQLRRHKDRINHHKGHQPTGGSPTSIPVEVFDSSDELVAGKEPEVVETDDIPAKPLAVEDAILQLELSGQDFLVFLNARRDEAVSVVYKRRDGNYGLITPNA